MPVLSGGPAPYGPSSAVIAIISGYRTRGWSPPFTLELLQRAGVSESLAPRVLQSLKLLDLIDDDGTPTPVFEGLRRAPGTAFQAGLAEVVRAAYQEVFLFVDPESDTEERIRDAFRVYEPLGQLNRMVSLFLGLCVEAGLRPATSIRSARPQQSSRPAQARPSVEASRRRRDGGESPNTWSAVKGPSSQGTGKAPQIHPAIVGLLNDLPVRWGAWTVAERDGFMQTFRLIADLYYQTPATGGGDSEG